MIVFFIFDLVRKGRWFREWFREIESVKEQI
jgi:hypothetical protein